MPEVRKRKRGYKSVIEKYKLDRKDRLLLKQITGYPATTLKELAKLLDISVNSAKKRMAKPAFKKAYVEISQTTDEALEGLARFAIIKLKKHLESENEKISIEACKLCLNQYLNRFQVQIDSKSLSEVIHCVRFGEQGQIISDTKEIEDTTPQNTLELLTKSSFRN